MIKLLRRTPLAKCGALSGIITSPKKFTTQLCLKHVCLPDGDWNKYNTTLQLTSHRGSNTGTQLRNNSSVNRSSASRVSVLVRPYLDLIRLDKPTGNWVIFWPGAWGIAMATAAGQLPSLQLLGLFGIGSFVMRGAGCTINDLWDRELDKKVTRTRDRPLSSGKMSPLQALVFLGGQLSVALAILMTLNSYTILLGVPSLLLVGVYPLMKRITFWPQVFLGLTINWGVLMGYSAVQGYCDWSVVAPLYGACVAWTMIYDTLYAYQDVADDITAGVKSTAMLFGDSGRVWLSAFASTMAALMVTSGYCAEQEWPYYLAVGVFAGHAAKKIYTVDFTNPLDCNKQFRSSAHIGVVVLLGILASNLIRTDSRDEKIHSSSCSHDELP